MLWRPELISLFNGGAPALLLFDLDGTLIDSVPDLAAAIDIMLRESGRQPAGEDNVSRWVGNGADKLIRRALTSGDEIAADALAADEVTPYRQIFDRAYLSALHHATGVYPGVQTFLDELTRADITKVLITNKPRLFTEPLIKSLGWQGQFVQLICGDDLAEKKPSPLPLLFACEQQNTDPVDALMIGDSKHDVGAAKAAGIKNIAVSYGYNHGNDIALSEPDLVVDSLLRLVEA